MISIERPMCVAPTTLYVDYAIYIYIWIFTRRFMHYSFYHFWHVNSRNMYLIGMWSLLWYFYRCTYAVFYVFLLFYPVIT